MEHVHRNNDGEVSEGIRYYWKVTKPITENYGEIIKKKFELNGKIWLCQPYVWHRFVRVAVNCLNDNSVRSEQPLLRVGMAGSDLQDIISLKRGNFKLSSGIMIYSEFNSILLRNKVLYFFIEAKRTDVITEKTPKQLVETDYKELLLSGQNSDVTLEVRGKNFNCHRCILAARSPVFASMMRKGNEVITIEDVEPDTFLDFLIYLYSGNDDHLSWKNIANLYTLANKYGVDDLKSICMDGTKMNIDMDSFFELFKLSQELNDSELSEITVEFFMQNSQEIVGSENWKTFLAENPVESNVLITALSTL